VISPLSKLDLDFSIQLTKASRRLSYILLSGLDDLTKGANERQYRVNKDSLIMRAQFDGSNVFYTIGNIREDDVEWLFSFPEAGEIHAYPPHKTLLTPADRSSRIVSFDPVRYYIFEPVQSPKSDSRCRPVLKPDFAEVMEFIKQFNDHSIFNDDLLQYPSIGIWEDGKLIGYVGTLFINKPLKACQIGNFLVHPEYRGQGLARALGQSLIQSLFDLNMKTFRLEVYEANIAAYRTYEHIGFQLEDLAPMAILRQRTIS
jgi:RimJ/RimL family protein N-acetyltransferase